jgi:hypothetical protein
MDIEKRIRMAAESILENESIREGLDDSGASALLDWGIARAKNIAGQSADLEDDDEAEEASYPKKRALRRMLEAAKSLVAQDLDSDQKTALLAELSESATIVYGSEISIPEQIYWDTFSTIKNSQPDQKITGLRALIEKNLKPEE